MIIKPAFSLSYSCPETVFSGYTEGQTGFANSGQKLFMKLMTPALFHICSPSYYLFSTKVKKDQNCQNVKCAANAL